MINAAQAAKRVVFEQSLEQELQRNEFDRTKLVSIDGTVVNYTITLKAPPVPLDSPWSGSVRLFMQGGRTWKYEVSAKTTPEPLVTGIAGVISRLKHSVDRTVQRANQKSAELQTREKIEKAFTSEIESLDLPDWLLVSPNTRGAVAGTYDVSFLDGSPLETLTADEVARLAKFLETLVR